jgi:hypothetical protein
MHDTFVNCRNIQTVPNIPDSVVNMSHTFLWCEKLQHAPTLGNSVNNLQCTFQECYNMQNAPTIPSSVAEMGGAFLHCYNITTAPDMSNAFNVTNMESTFYNCKKLTGNINIVSENITNAQLCFYDTTLTKNVYIPFTYENGINTKTYNAFIDAGYKNDGSICGVYLRDINNPYHPGDTLFESENSGTYTFVVPVAGKYQITGVGGGAGSLSVYNGSSKYTSTGGAGALVRANFIFLEGDDLNITIGGKGTDKENLNSESYEQRYRCFTSTSGGATYVVSNTTFSNRLFTAGGGGSATIDWRNSETINNMWNATGGQGLTYGYNVPYQGNTYVGSNGNWSPTGSASGATGSISANGAGASASIESMYVSIPGRNGYIKIVYLE